MYSQTFNYNPYPKRQLISGVAPFVIGALLYVAGAIVLLPEQWRIGALVLLFILCLTMTIVMTFIATSRLPNKIIRWRLMLAPAVLVVGSFVLHLMIGSAVARFATVTATMLLLLIYVIRVDYLNSCAEKEVPEATESAIGFGRMIMIIGLFSLLVFAFGIRQFMQIPLVVYSLIIGGLLFLISYEALFQSGAEAKHHLLASLGIGLIGVEIFIAMWFLPTTYLVNASVVTLLNFMIIRVTVRILAGDTGTKGLRIGLIIGFVLTVLVLATSRWT